MSEFLQPFKKEYVAEYMRIVLDSFKSNDPYFAAGLINDDDFLR
jgi:hypothetical protein